MKILRSDKRIHCLFHYTYTLHSEIWQKRVIFFEVFACLTRQNQTEISFFKQVFYPLFLPQNSSTKTPHNSDAPELSAFGLSARGSIETKQCQYRPRTWECKNNSVTLRKMREHKIRQRNRVFLPLLLYLCLLKQLKRF